jgi:hypothetical protein
MGEFSLTVTLEGVLVGLGGETKRVEETNRGEGTRDGINRESLRRITVRMRGVWLATLSEPLEEVKTRLDYPFIFRILPVPWRPPW